MTERWTAEDIPSQAGRRVLITGANSGIGYYAALELARKGAHVLLGCRDRGKGEAALARIRAEVPNAAAEGLDPTLECLPEALRFHPVAVHGESIADAIEEERGNL